MNKHRYDTTAFPFAELVTSYLGCEDLALVHDHTRFTERLQADTDQSTELHRRFYAGMDSGPEFKALYDRFIREVVTPLFDAPFIFQRFPTFRCHQPDNVAVFEFHRDRDYQHHPKEVNIFLPMTRAFDSNTFWIESEEDKGDYAPAEADYGEILVFDGANLRHGNQANETGLSRVSFDFRVLPEAHYDEEAQLAKTSKSKGRRFVVGEYFDRF